MKVPKLTHQVAEVIAARHWLPTGARVLAAVSGGPDSVALAGLLHELGLLAGIAHCNYGLRLGADAETGLVLGLGKRFGVPVHVQRVDPAMLKAAKDSVQLVAREIRYAFFEALIAEHHYHKCAMGHQQEDQVESILMSLLRSRDERVLRGIPEAQGPYIRPLLHFKKQSLIDYCEAQGLPYGIDESNFTSIYLRNDIRLHLVPQLQAINPDFEARLLEAAEDLRLQQEWMEGFFHEIAPQVLHEAQDTQMLDFARLDAMRPAVPLALFLPWWLRRLGFTGQEIRQLQNLAHSSAGARITLGAGTLLRTHEGLGFRAGLDREDSAAVSVERESGVLGYGKWTLELDSGPFQGEYVVPKREGVEEYWMDLDRVRFPLKLRGWLVGDRMIPLGMRASKKLSDIFVDAQRGRFSKQDAFVLEDAAGEIICLSGFRISEQVKLHANTKMVLRIRCRFGRASM